MSATKKSYRLLVEGADYPSGKDGKRRSVVKGDIITDFPASDIKDLLKIGAIEEVTAEKEANE